MSSSTRTGTRPWLLVGTCAAVDAVVVGSGIEPRDLTLSEVNDTSVYHFDGLRPITFPETFNEARAEALAPVGGEPPDHDDVWWPAHPDQASFLE